MLHVSRQGQPERQVAASQSHQYQTRTWWREGLFEWPDLAHFALPWLRFKARLNLVELEALECM